MGSGPGFPSSPRDSPEYLLYPLGPNRLNSCHSSLRDLQSPQPLPLDLSATERQMTVSVSDDSLRPQGDGQLTSGSRNKGCL